MKNIVRNTLLLLFCLLSHQGIGMELVLDLKTDIKDMQKGLEIHETPKDTPSDNVLTVINGTEGSVKIFRVLPKEIWQQVWDFLSNKDKLQLSLASRDFYKTIGQNTHFAISTANLEKMFRNQNTPYFKSYPKSNFEILLRSTHIIDGLSKEAHDPVLKEQAAVFLDKQKENGSSFLNGFRFAQRGDEFHSKTETYENYAYLCKIYENDYDKITCCTQMGYCCENSCLNCAECCGTSCILFVGCCLISGLICYDVCCCQTQE